jgi:glycosyltransferase involved in cell wall biosynthesis
MVINLVTDITGFPFGTAPAKRIIMLGKSIANSGVTFKVFTNTLINNEYNRESEGVYNSIYFKYLHGKVNLKVNNLKRSLLYILGCINIFFIIRRMNKIENIIYIYSQGRIFNLYIISICKIFKIKIVQEINEWSHNDLGLYIRKKIVEGPMIKKSEGAIIISKHIQDLVNLINPKIRSIIIPVLEDPLNYNEPIINSPKKYCFWTGEVDGYLEDVLIIIAACAKTWKSGLYYSLVFSGPCSNLSRAKILSFALGCGFPVHEIEILGFIDEQLLINYCKKAYFYILPLWNNERSASRFPTKLALFMFSGKPVISCNVGELKRLLTDKVNVLYFEPGDKNDLAEKIKYLLMNKNVYDEMCDKTRYFAQNNFSYLMYSDKLKSFFESILNESIFT